MSLNDDLNMRAAMTQENDKAAEVVCPFCGENDFDLIGLKCHLARHCEPYDKTPWED